MQPQFSLLMQTKTGRVEPKQGIRKHQIFNRTKNKNQS